MPRIGLRRSPLSWVALAVALTVATPASASPELSGYGPLAEPVSSGSRSTFEPLPPTKLFDSRQSSAIGAGLTRAVQVTGAAGVPADATAVVVNITVVNPSVGGYVIVYPNGAARPPVASITFPAKQTIANLATVKVGSLGRIVVFNSTGAARHVLLDVTGYYREHAHDDRYLPKADAQGRTAPNAFNCAEGTILRSVAADGTPTCETLPDAGASYVIGDGLRLDGATLSAEQGRSATGAFACVIGSYLQAVAADGAPTCAVDKDTDTDTNTTYTAGPGLALNGTTFSAEQGRSAPNAFFCASGMYLRAASATGAPTCAEDSGVQFTTGLGLLLSNGVLSAEQGRSATNAFTCPVGWYLRVVAANGAPTCAQDVDTDTDTTYAAGFGLYLDGNVFAAEQGRSAANAFFCPAGQFLRAVAADGTPTCGADTGTTYAAGAGITITGTTIAAHQSRSAPNAFACAAGQYLQTVAANGAPTCGTDTTYTAGSGLALAGGTFSSAYGSTVIPVRADGTPVDNGTLLRNAMNAVTGATEERPYVLSLAPGTYELGASSLTMKPYVSVVGAGRGFTTITGARVSQSGGLVNLGNNTTLAGVTVRNMVPAGASWVTAIMSNGANVARLYDVHGYASQEGGEVYGLIAFAGSNISIESSQFTVINPTQIGTGIYAISSATVRARNVEVGHGAVGGWALHSYNASRLEFADGYANGAVRKGTPDSVLHLTHSKVDGVVNGGVQCFGAYTSAMVAATCT